MMSNEPAPSQADVLKVLMTREAVKASSEIMVAIGFDPTTLANEMIVRAFLIAQPDLTVETAQDQMLAVWKMLLADLRKGAAAPFKPVVVGGTQAPANDDAVSLP
jgi:hypothetical protein